MRYNDYVKTIGGFIMKKITNDNLLTFIHDYFSSIGLKREAKSFSTDDKFDNGIILCLPDVCLLPKNK